MNQKISIFFTVNNFYIKYLSVAIYSIIVNTRRNVHFYLIANDISEENKCRLNKLKNIRPFEIEYLMIDKSQFRSLPPSHGKHISAETNYRFVIASLVPNLDKIIFLDADLCFVGDIGKIWDIDITDHCMLACIDPLCDTYTSILPLAPGFRYVNTGVFVANLKRWRAMNIETKLFETVSKYSHLFRLPDQDTLNITLAPYTKYLPAWCNAIPTLPYKDDIVYREAFSAPVVIHWAGSQKPWGNPGVKMGDLFWRYAVQTPFWADIIYGAMNSIRRSNQIQNRLITDGLQILTLKRKYLRYRILSKITFGKIRKRYKRKKQEFKTRIKAVKNFIRGK